MEKKYNIFVCYSRKDLDIVRYYYHDLQMAGLKLWFDMDCVMSGDTFENRMAEAISNCSVFLFFHSQNANESHWMRHEVYYAWEKGLRIVTIKLDNSDFAGSLRLLLANVPYINHSINNYKETITWLTSILGGNQINDGVLVKKYDVFISCKSEDYGYAEEVYNFLNSNGIRTFLASKELRKLGESEYREAIVCAIESSYHLIIFASKAQYTLSKWVKYEWDLFVSAKLDGRKEGQIMTILKGFNTAELRSDLIIYESFTFANYKERLLSYVETPESRREKEEQKRQEELFRRQAAIEARKRIEEEKRARIREEEYQMALADTRRNETEERICEESKARVHDSEIDLEWLSSKRDHIIEILRNLGIFITHIQATVGVSSTLFEVTLTPTMHVSKVRNLSDDIVRSLNVNKARVLAPIPNKNTIGIEIPNKS